MQFSQMTGFNKTQSHLKLDQLMKLTSAVRLFRLSIFCNLVTDRTLYKADSLSFLQHFLELIEYVNNQVNNRKQ